MVLMTEKKPGAASSKSLIGNVIEPALPGPVASAATIGLGIQAASALGVEPPEATSAVVGVIKPGQPVAAIGSNDLPQPVSAAPGEYPPLPTSDPLSNLEANANSG